MGVSVIIINGKVVSDPFPKSDNPNIAVVTSVPIRAPGGTPSIFGNVSDQRRIRTRSKSRTPEPNLPDFAIDDRIEKGSSFFPSQTPSRSLSSINIGDPKIVKKVTSQKFLWWAILKSPTC